MHRSVMPTIGRIVKPNIPSMDMIVDENDDFNAREEPEMWFMDKGEPPAQILSGRELREKYFSKKPSSNLLPAHVDEPVAMSSAPRPPDNNIVQPMFVYKNKDLENPVDDDIVVVNTSQVCHICSEHFATEDELSQHTLLHENGMWDEANALNLHMCKICGKKFSTDGNLNRHMKIHTGEKPFQCNNCGRQFTQSNDLKRHIKIHMRTDGIEGSTCTRELPQTVDSGTNSPNVLDAGEGDGNNYSVDDEMYACGTCGKRYTSFPNLKRHMKLHAGLQSSQYEVIVNDQMGMKSNIEGSPNKNEKYFLCKVCHNSYTSLGNLKRHIESSHNGVVNDSLLSDLDTTTTMDEDMESEMSSVQKTKPFPSVGNNGSYPCHLCGKTYTTENSMKRHLKLHSGMSGNEYEVVDRDSLRYQNGGFDGDDHFDNLQSIDDGYRSEQGSGGKIFVCKVCGKYYSTLGNLKRHLKLNHSNMDTTVMAERAVTERAENSLNGTPENMSEDGSDDSVLYIDENNEMDKSGNGPEHDIYERQSMQNNTHSSYNMKQMVNPAALQNGGGGRIQNSRFGVKNYKSTAKTTWCKLCGKSYFNISNLKRHIKIVHTGASDVELTPPKNRSQNGTYSPAVDHSAQMTETHTCHICEKSFSTGQKLKSHMQLHGDMNVQQEDDIVVVYPSENEHEGQQEYQMDRTEEKGNSAEKPKEVTADGLKSTPTKDKSQDSLEDSFVCHVCGKSYSCHGNLKIHMKLNHDFVEDSPQQPGKPSQLNIKQSTLGVPNSPLSPTSPTEKKFICNVCSKPFSSILKLKRHLKLHPGFKVCQYDSSDGANELNGESNSPLTMTDLPSTQLTQLVKAPSGIMELDDITEGATMCHICGKQYSTVGNLKRHMKLNHPGDEETETTTCVICGRDYASVGNLKRHMKLNHSGGKNEDSAKFNSMATNSDEAAEFTESGKGELVDEKYFCHVCGQQCSSLDTLKRHLKVQHDENLHDIVNGVHENENSTMVMSTEKNVLRRTPSLENLDQSQRPHLASSVAPSDLSETDSFEMPKVGSREPCACTVCGKPYSTPGNLRRHMKLHMNMNNSQYKVVDRQSYPSFVDYEEPGKSLVETLQSLDPNSNPITMDDYNKELGKSYACTVCGKSYLCLGNLKRHLDSTSCGVDNPQCGASDGGTSRTESSYTNGRRASDSSDNTASEWSISEVTSQGNRVENIMHNGGSNIVEVRDSWSVSDNGMEVDEDANNTDNEDIDESMISIDINADVGTEYTRVKSRNEEIVQPPEPTTKYRTKGTPTKISNGASNLNDSAHTCTICGQQYTTYEFLQCHMATHTTPTNRKQPQHTRLKTPSRSSGGEDSSSPRSGGRSHICPICNKEFSTGSNMSRHMKIHSGVKPYQCKGCDRYFTQSNDLKRHIKTHCPESDPTISGVVVLPSHDAPAVVS